MSKHLKLEYIFLKESLRRLNDDVARISDSSPDISVEQCYDMMCQIEIAKDAIARFEKHIKIKSKLF